MAAHKVPLPISPTMVIARRVRKVLHLGKLISVWPGKELLTEKFQTFSSSLVPFFKVTDAIVIIPTEARTESLCRTFGLLIRALEWNRKFAGTGTHHSHQDQNFLFFK
ncbi:hypothetical protein RvY_12862 [Ramazzottius varieornatus]|uniref:Uncharacterized protein n=1 Tax=Ramazzottius varieornatus TaxID=947166 RepID=A0A1D1VKX3_RAMVA|nr:hypothetical protein RvY_12862 [Ramazzottius varieornatus]